MLRVFEKKMSGGGGVQECCRGHIFIYYINSTYIIYFMQSLPEMVCFKNITAMEIAWWLPHGCDAVNGDKLYAI